MASGPIDAQTFADLLSSSIRRGDDLLTPLMRKGLIHSITDDVVARSQASTDANMRLAASLLGTRWLEDRDANEWKVLHSVFDARKIKTDWSLGAPEAFRNFLNSQFQRGRFAKVASSSDGVLLIVVRVRSMDQAIASVYDMLTPDERDFWYQSPKTVPAVLFRLPLRTFDNVLDTDGSAIVASAQIWVTFPSGELGMVHMFLYWEPKAAAWIPLQITCRGKECVTWH